MSVETIGDLSGSIIDWGDFEQSMGGNSSYGPEQRTFTGASYEDRGPELATKNAGVVHYLGKIPIGCGHDVIIVDLSDVCACDANVAEFDKPNPIINSHIPAWPDGVGDEQPFTD